MVNFSLNMICNHQLVMSYTIHISTNAFLLGKTTTKTINYLIKLTAMSAKLSSMLVGDEISQRFGETKIGDSTLLNKHFIQLNNKCLQFSKNLNIIL